MSFSHRFFKPSIIIASTTLALSGMWFFANSYYVKNSAPSVKQLSTDDKFYLREAFHLAKLSREHGSHPFGALLVCDNKIFLTGENQVNAQKNPLRHAETVLLENYVTYKNADEKTRQLMSPNFNGSLPDIEKCQMFTSTQPCEMCEGAIYTLKVGAKLQGKTPQVIFGLDKPNLSIAVRGFEKKDHDVKVDGPHLLEEAREVHKGFWRP